MTGPTEGAIEQGVLPPLLRDLYVRRRTGLLHFTHGEDRGSVCFIKGHIAWGQSSLEECRLGPVLVRHGLVSQESIDQAYELVGRGKRLGDVLLEAGSLDRETLDQALALQVRETLLTVFGWHEGGWRFEEHDPDHFKGYDQALRVSTGDLIMDAVWSVADPDVIRYALGDLNRPLSLTTDPLLRFQRIALTQMDGLLVSQADGVRTAKEVLATVPEDAHEAQRSLFGLLCTGLLELEDLPESPALPVVELPLTRQEVLQTHRGLAAKDHFEVLGITRSASGEEARAAFVRLARRFHPDAQADPELATVRTQIEEIFTRLADAERVLTIPPRRAEYEKRLVLTDVQTLLRADEPSDEPEPAPPLDPMAQALSHEQVLVGAEQQFAEGRYWDALQAVEPLLGELQGRMRRRGLLLRARALGQNPKWRKESEDQLKEILAEDPGNVDALFHLGQLYKAGGMSTRATAAFRKVLELRPRHAGALAELGS
jgi:tetratricopeptide (TPR) repeat protein